MATGHLEQGFQLLFERHQVLRARYEQTAGGLRQRIQPQVVFHIPEIDLSGMAPAEAQAEAERIAELEARASFDLLGTPPFIRATRLHFDSHNSMLLLTAHHIVMDGWSLGILASELGEVCDALGAGRRPSLPRLHLDFSGYSQGCAGEGDEGGPEADRQYWADALRGMRHFEVPADRLRPPLRTANGQILSLPLSRSLTADFAGLARTQGCTTFMAATAVLLTLLHRYTGETDIGIGTQTPGRDRPELEPLVGPFVNTLVLRNDLSGDPPFVELLERVCAVVLGAFDHPLPIEQVIDIVRPQRDPSRPPLFSVNFVAHRPHVKNASYGSFRLIEQPSLSSGPMYDLSFFMVEQARGWLFSCEYDADLFERRTVECLLRGFEALLRGVVTDPGCRLSRLPVMEPADREALLAAWNHTTAEYPRQRTAVQLFQEQVALRPEHMALVAGEASLSYAELDRASDRLAAALLRRGLGNGSRIGLFLNRSAELVVALLAVLKAGAAYIPIDPAHPQERRRYVITSAGLGALLSVAALRERIGEVAVPVLLLDQQAGMPDECGDLPPQPATTEAVAYLIYTSGSTGRPKGVQISHRSLVNLLWHCRREPGLGPGDVFLALSTIAFDIATLELLLPLSVGARLVLAGDEQAANGEAIAELLARYQVTAMFAAPVTWQLLLLAGWEGRPGLKMLCGGEAMPRALAESLLRRGAELWNLYGPTETTILSSAVRVERGEGPVPLGPPISNTRFYLLDQYLEPVLPGAPGELYIGGDGVGLGYLNQPALTAERFLPDHIGGSGRLYRTGDLMRARGDGKLEYLGRADGQVKLRGLRIELGEIESILLERPDIAEALAMVLPDGAGMDAIAAYVVPRRPAADPAALADDLRACLARFLPKYMCPASLSVLDAMPRLPNGKLDRRALPLPSPARGGPPLDLSPVEQNVAAIWRDLLGGAEVRADSNFFELGGHSLLAAHMLERIDRRFGLRIALSTLFQDPTVRGVARVLEQRKAREYDFRQVIKLQPNGARAPLIAINNTGIYGVLAKKLGADRPFTSLQLFDPALPTQVLPGTLEEIAEGYVRLILRTQPEGPYALLGWCVAGTLAFEIARQLAALGRGVSHLFMIDTEVPRHFERMSPLRRVLGRSALRFKLVVRDWVDVRRSRMGLATFMLRRTTVRALLRRLGQEPGESKAAASAGDERYDQWLLHYLQEAAERYEPRPYPRRLVLFRSAEEPKGAFLDHSMGWAAFSRGGVDVVEIDGDHFSMFRDPGAGQMAQYIADRLDADPLR